jgi:hypothetical protein
MKKLIAAVFAAALVLAATWKTSGEAQVVTADGNSLQQKSARVRDALLEGTGEQLMLQLAPWIQGRLELSHELWTAALAMDAEELKDEGTSQEEMVTAMLKSLHKEDPADTLKLRTIEDLKGLQPAQLVSLSCGQLRLQAIENVKDRISAKWHLVDRAIYTAEERIRHRGDRKALRTYGRVAFINKHGDKIEVTCAAEGGQWEVVDFEAIVADHKAKLRAGTPIAGSDVSTRDARRSEGEQILGSMRNRVRVAYAKMDSAPDKLTGQVNGSGSGCDASDLEGKYFSVRDKVYHGDKENMLALIVEPMEDNGADGFGVLTFNVVNGRGEIKWYGTEDELDEAIDEFTGR